MRWGHGQHHWTDLAPQDLWMHHAAPMVVEEDHNTLGFKTYFTLLAQHIFSPFSPVLCVVSPFPLPTTEHRAVPAPSPLMVLRITHHHCLPQGKLLLPGLESKVRRNYRN